jgi:thioredoxin reductase (NADPH)
VSLLLFLSVFLFQRVSTCATCDGAFFKDQQVVVVGGGDAAMEEAVFLTKFASKVTLVHRRDTFEKASKTMVERAMAHPKIEFKSNRTVKRWVAEKPETDGNSFLGMAAAPSLVGVVLEDTWATTEEGEKREERVDCTGAFIAIGHRPMTDLVRLCVFELHLLKLHMSAMPLRQLSFATTPLLRTSSSSSLFSLSSSSSSLQFRGKKNDEGGEKGEEDILTLDSDGYIVHSIHTMTSVPGVFAAGDVVDRRYRQAITAAGMGCQAAMDAEKWIAEKEA